MYPSNELLYSSLIQNTERCAGLYSTWPKELHPETVKAEASSNYWWFAVPDGLGFFAASVKNENYTAVEMRVGAGPFPEATVVTKTRLVANVNPEPVVGFYRKYLIDTLLKVKAEEQSIINFKATVLRLDYESSILGRINRCFICLNSGLQAIANKIHNLPIIGRIFPFWLFGG